MTWIGQSEQKLHHGRPKVAPRREWVKKSVGNAYIKDGQRVFSVRAMTELQGNFRTSLFVTWNIADRNAICGNNVDNFSLNLSINFSKYNTYILDGVGLPFRTTFLRWIFFSHIDWWADGEPPLPFRLMHKNFISSKTLVFWGWGPKILGFCGSRASSIFPIG